MRLLFCRLGVNVFLNAQRQGNDGVAGSHEFH